jgi:hypothetical protein
LSSRISQARMVLGSFPPGENPGVSYLDSASGPGYGPTNKFG